MNTVDSSHVQSITNISQTPQSPAGEIPVTQIPAGPIMKSSKPRQRLIFLILGLVILAVVAIIALVSFRFSLRTPKAPFWNDLTPGTSTREEVIERLGQPIREERLPFSQALFYPSGYEILPNTVILDEKDQVKSILVQVPSGEEIKLSDWMRQYGKPEKEMWNNYSAETKTYLFPKKGATVVASQQIDRVAAIHYFIPMSLDDYLAIWGENLFEGNPYLD